MESGKFSAIFIVCQRLMQNIVYIWPIESAVIVKEGRAMKLITYVKIVT